MKECVIMETDILWGACPATPEDEYRGYHDMWLRLAKNIGQAGRPVVLCGTALPKQIEPCPERRYFSVVYYLAMVCDDASLRDRLNARPQWRGSGSHEFVERMVQFNQWLKEHAATTTPPMTLYETSHRSIQETTQEVAQWIRERL
jgi:hypothetical protein